jgi:hypothetical protein
MSALLLALVAALLFTASASAIEIGSLCTGDQAGSGARTIVQNERQISTVQIDTTSPGVVTRWKVNTLGSTQLAREERVKVFKRLETTKLEAVAESTPQMVQPERLNEFEARIPVPVGVRFGVYSSGASPLYCASSPPSTSDNFYESNNDVPVGVTATINTVRVGVVALAVDVEPDADHDGFGDETQDFCPTNPLSQCVPMAAPPGGDMTTAPAPTPAALSLQLKAKLEGNVVAVQVAGSAAATVAVSDSFRGRSVAGPKSAALTPGQVARAYLPLSAALKRQLQKLPRKRKVNLLIEASGQGAAGGSGAASIELTLHGRKKPARPHRHSH